MIKLVRWMNLTIFSRSLRLMEAHHVGTVIVIIQRRVKAGRREKLG
jgi:hypothetical protein